MKKSKLLVAVLTATALVGGGALAGCGHSHEYSEDWKNDANGHWHVATCDDLKEGDEGYTKDYAAHVWGDDNECDVCNYKKKETPPPPTEVTTSVKLNKTELKLGIGNLEAELTATVEGGGTVKWESDNPEVVAVNEDTGYVEAFKPGAATITATVVGGEASATCEVVVDNGYYLIGGPDAAWNKVGVFGQSGVFYFMPTETKGIYKTESLELKKLGNFQVAPVGDTSGDWWKKAFNGDYIATGDEVLSRNDGGNIAVQKHGMYTITLDLTGEKAVISGVCDEEIDDSGVEEIYYLIGDANASSGWSLLETAEAAGDYAFVSNGDGTHSLTVELTRGKKFQVAIIGNQWNGAMDESAVPLNLIGANGTATVDTAYKLTWTNGSADITVGLSGKYTFTLNPDGETRNKLSYTFEQTDDTETVIEETVLHFYIKCSKVTNNWAQITTDNYELKETAAGSGIYTMTIAMEADDVFMFYSMDVGVDTGNMTAGTVYIQAQHLAEDITCVVKNGTNLKTVEAGNYTFTYDSSTQKLNVTFAAATEE